MDWRLRATTVAQYIIKCVGTQHIRLDRNRGHFEGERVETPFPLLKCLRTHYGRHCKPFYGQNAPDCRILHIQSHIFSGVELPRRLDPYANFRLARQRSHCSCFTKRSLGRHANYSLSVLRTSRIKFTVQCIMTPLA